MGFMSGTSKRLANKAKNLSKALSGRFSNEAGTSSDAASSRAAPRSFDFQPELYGDDDAHEQHVVVEAPATKTRPSRGSGSLHMSDSAFSEAASNPRDGATRTSSTPALAPASAGSWGDMRSSQDSALPCGALGTPTTGSRGDLTEGTGAQDESRACKDDSARQSADSGGATKAMAVSKAAVRSSFALERQSLDVNRAALKRFGAPHKYSLSDEPASMPSVATEDSVCLQLGIPPRCRACFLLLAALPRNTPVPLGTLERLWGCRARPGEAQDTAQLLQTAGALHVVAIGSGDLWCLVPPGHLQLLHTACRARLPAMHAALLAAYLQETSAASLCDLEDDGYIVNNAGYHLVGAGRLDDLRELLLSPTWLETKARAYGHASVVADFRRYLMVRTDPNLKLLLEAFQRAALGGGGWEGTLAVQMAARLMAVTTSTMIKEWCSQQHEQSALRARVLRGKAPAPLWPVTASLEQAGGLQRLVLRGHSAGIVHVAMLPSGVEAVTASKDGTLRVWDLEIGDATLVLEGHAGPVTCFEANAAGDFLISGSVDQTARLWELERGRCMRVLQGHMSGVCSVALDPKTRFAVSLGTDGVAWVWELAGGTCVHVLQSPHRSVLDTGLTHRVVLSPDGRTCITCGGGFEACVWDLSKGTLLRCLQGHSSWVVDVAVSPDACRAATASHDGRIMMWDLWSGACEHVMEGHSARVNRVVMSQDGQRLVSASDDATLRVYDSRTCELRHTLTGHTSWVNDVALTEGGALCATAAGEPVSRVFDLTRGECVRVLEGHAAEVHSVAMTRRGRFVVTGSEDGAARVWDLHAPKRPPPARHAGAVHAVLPTPDRTRFLTAGEDGTVRVWDAATGEQLGCMEHGCAVTVLALTDGGALAVSAAGNRSVRVWDIQSASLYSQLPAQPGSRLKSLAIGPDAAYAVQTLWDSSVTLLDVASGETLRTLQQGRGMAGGEGHAGGVNGCVVSPDGQACVTTSKDATARVWDLQSGQCVRVLQGHCDAVHAAVYATNGTRIVTCSFDNTARVWDACSGACLGVLPHDEAPTVAVASADGGVVVTVAGDGARLWRVEEVEGQAASGVEQQQQQLGCCVEVARLGGLGATVADVAMSPDGLLAAVCGQDGGVLVYETARGTVVGVFCADAPCRCCAFGGCGAPWVLAVGTDPGQVHFLECVVSV